MYLAGLGLSVGDLPNQGRNIRLYLHYGVGSPQATPPLVGNPGGCSTTAGCFMTGHYDLSLPGGPCSQSDPREFASWAEMSNYAGSRGETLVLTSSNDEVNALCSQTAPQSAVSYPTALPPSTYVPPTTITPPTSSSGIPITIFKPVPVVQTGVPVPPVTYVPGQGPVVNVAPAETSGTPDYLPYILGGFALLAIM